MENETEYYTCPDCERLFLRMTSAGLCKSCLEIALERDDSDDDEAPEDYTEYVRA